MLSLIRTWVPGTLVAIGLGYIIIHGGSEPSLHVGIPTFSAGLSVFLLNFLYRVGVSSDKDRGTEEDARQFHAEFGRWPNPDELAAYHHRHAEPVA